MAKDTHRGEWVVMLGSNAAWSRSYSCYTGNSAPMQRNRRGNPCWGESLFREGKKPCFWKTRAAAEAKVAWLGKGFLERNGVSVVQLDYTDKELDQLPNEHGQEMLAVLKKLLTTPVSDEAYAWLANNGIVTEAQKVVAKAEGTDQP